MKLYWAPQTRAASALWVLEESGARYERSLVDIRAGAQMTAAYRAINPMGKVPALDDDGTIVTEAAAICAHVADRFPAASLAPPIGDPARGAYYRWLVFEPACIEPAFMQKHTGLEVDSTTAAWGSYDRVIDTLDAALATGPWILGENFTAADVMVGGAVRFGIAVKMIEPRPSFSAYVSRCEGRPAFQRAVLIDERGV
ncbi:MAG: glutathione S-transferase family protein [Dongiaceae bacterium]